MKGKMMMGALVAAILAGVASAGLLSEVVFTLTSDVLQSPWNFYAQIDDLATDGFDNGIDAVEPPPAPFTEIRMHSVASEAPGLLATDARDGAGGYEVWPEIYVDGYSFPRTGADVTITWDLSGANGWVYILTNLDTGEVIDLQSQGEYSFHMGSAVGPWFELTAEYVIPEPGTIALLLSGISGIVAFGVRKR